MFQIIQSLYKILSDCPAWCPIDQHELNLLYFLYFERVKS